MLRVHLNSCRRTMMVTGAPSGRGMPMRSISSFMSALVGYVFINGGVAVQNMDLHTVASAPTV